MEFKPRRYNRSALSLLEIVGEVLVLTSIYLVMPVVWVRFRLALIGGVTVAGLDRAIKQAYPHVQRIFIEIETWQAKEKHRDSLYRNDTRK